MQHDADLPIAKDAGARWNAASEQEKAMAYVGLQLDPVRPHTMRENRRRERALWLNNVSWLAMRNAGALMSPASKERAKTKEQARLEKMRRLTAMYGGVGRLMSYLDEYEGTFNGDTL